MIEILRREARRDRLGEVAPGEGPRDGGRGRKRRDAIEPGLVCETPNAADEAAGGRIEDPDTGALERRDPVALEDVARDGPLARREAERAHSGLIERDRSDANGDRVGGLARRVAIPPL